MAASQHETLQANTQDVAHVMNLEDTIRELEDKVKEHQDALNKVSCFARFPYSGCFISKSKLNRNVSYVRVLPLSAVRAGVFPRQRHSIS